MSPIPRSHKHVRHRVYAYIYVAFLDSTAETRTAPDGSAFSKRASLVRLCGSAVETREGDDKLVGYREPARVFVTS